MSYKIVTRNLLFTLRQINDDDDDDDDDASFMSYTLLFYNLCVKNLMCTF